MDKTNNSDHVPIKGQDTSRPNVDVRSGGGEIAENESKRKNPTRDLIKRDTGDGGRMTSEERWEVDRDNRVSHERNLSSQPKKKRD